MQASKGTVFVVDPDPDSHAVIRELVSTIELPCETFATGREFFAAYDEMTPGCLVLEVRIPDMSGMQIERRVAALRIPPPVIFVSGQTDVTLAVELMRRGCVHYLQKPPLPAELLGAIQEAIELDQRRRQTWQRAKWIAERIAMLTRKEQDVLRMMADDHPNRAIAEQLGVSQRTVEIRRANLIRKLRLKSPMALVRFALHVKRQARRFQLDSSAS